MIFVDTGAWFAPFVPNDPDHAAAEAWLAENQEDMLTSDYVLDVLFTLLKARGEFQRATQIGGSLLAGTIAHLQWFLPIDIQTAWETFQTFQDQGGALPSFCLSFRISNRIEMRRTSRIGRVLWAAKI